jgi:drug/metabolite transporter (DMT)-like permease
MCVLWGVPYLLIRVAVRELSPAVLVLGRTSVSAAILLPLAATRGELEPLRRHWRWVAAFAAVEIGVPWLLLGTAEERVPSSLTALLLAGVPLVGAVIARTSGRRERLAAMNAAGLAIGLVGVAAIAGLDARTASAGGLLEVASVAVCYATGPVILTRRLRDVSGLAVISASLAGVALAYLPIAAFQLPPSWPSPRVDAAVVALAVVCTAVAFLVFFALIAEVGPVRATVITYVNPAVAALAGVAFLGESFTGGMGVGFVLILAGSVLATRLVPPVAAPEPVAAVQPD